MALAYGLDIADLPDGWTPLEAVIILRCMDEDGEDREVLRSTDMRDCDVVGLLRIAEWNMLNANRWEDE